jgi:hypothetical protein
MPMRGWVFGARGADRPEYWIYFVMSRSEQLVDMDQFLRNTWVDCCGHLSAFNIGGQRFESHGGSTGPAHGKPPGSLTPKITSVLDKGDEFKYIYDFANPTELTLKCFGQHAWPDPAQLTLDEPIAWGKGMAIAQNDALEFDCAECGEEATLFCTERGVGAEAALCEACAEETECDEESQLPLANSPRSGMCRFGLKELVPAAE